VKVIVFEDLIDFIILRALPIAEALPKIAEKIFRSSELPIFLERELRPLDHRTVDVKVLNSQTRVSSP